MATTEVMEVPDQELGIRWRRKSRSASEIDAGIARSVGFILENIPPRTDLIKMGRHGTRQVRHINGTTWEMTVENHTVGHDLGMDIPPTRSIVMKGEGVEFRLVTDWEIKTGIGLTQQRTGGPPLMAGLDGLSLNL